MKFKESENVELKRTGLLLSAVGHLTLAAFARGFLACRNASILALGSLLSGIMHL